MPIKGISEIRRFSRGGKIRLGEKRKNKGGKEYPAALDYFLFDPDDETVLPLLHERYGEKPRKLRIAFPSEDEEVVFSQWYKLYRASGLMCKGDGETASRVMDDGTRQQFTCPGPDLCELSREKGVNGKPGCKMVAVLTFFLVDWNQMYVWQANSGGMITVVDINSQLELLRNIAGRISFIPVDLVLKPVTVQPDGKKKIVYALDLIIPVGLNQINALRPLVGPNAAPIALPPPDESVPDDLYPASQIEVVVDEDGVVQDDETLALNAEPEYMNYEELPEMKQLLEKRPGVANAILGQAEGERWPVEQVLDLVRKKLNE